MYFLYKWCWENDSPLSQGEQQEVPPSVSRSLTSVADYLPNLPVGNYLRVQQLAVKYVSPSRQDLNLRVILEPPVETCCECHVTERYIQGILYFILMRCNRDGGICNIRSWKCSGCCKARARINSGCLPDEKIWPKTPRVQVSPVFSSARAPSNKGPQMIPSHPLPLACTLADFPGLK